MCNLIETLNAERMEKRASHIKTGKRSELKSAILKLLKTRRTGASICPSEAARVVFKEDWREQMPQVRIVASEMVSQNQIEICQKGVAVNPATIKGPIRLRICNKGSAAAIPSTHSINFEDNV